MTLPRPVLVLILFVTGMARGAAEALPEERAPLKVFILSGQSNMQGHAHVRTFDHLAMDPETAPLLEKMRMEDGSPHVSRNVWISRFSGEEVGQGELHGALTVGYGAERNGPKIGPEFTFGICVHELLNEPILLIKTAWGGKSLHTDFRPPSAGVYELNETQVQLFEKQGKDVEAIRSQQAEASGHYYRLMIDHVNAVLQDVSRVCPAYDPKQGYELAGFVWFQGWNDMVARNVYPQRSEPGGYDLYTELLAQFIRDVRRDLAAPKLPFVIGVMGVGGVARNPDHFRDAMAAPAAMPEFRDNVVAVRTEQAWDDQIGELAQRWDKVKAKSRTLNKDEALTKDQRAAALEQFKAELFTPEEQALREVAISNAAYHYLGSAKIMARIGQSFAEAMVELMGASEGE